MAVARRSDAGNQNVVGATGAQAFNIPTVLPGDAVVVGGSIQSGGGKPTSVAVTDNQGNGTYTNDEYANGTAAIPALIARKLSVAASGTFTITVTPAPTTGVFFALSGIAFSGVSALDVHTNSGGGAATTSVGVGTTAATAAVDSVAIIAMSADTGNNVVSIAATNYTIVGSDVNGTTDQVGALGFKVLTGAGAQAPTFTLGSSAAAQAVGVIAVYSGLPPYQGGSLLEQPEGDDRFVALLDGKGWAGVDLAGWVADELVTSSGIALVATDAATLADSATQLAVLPAASTDAATAADTGVDLAVLPAAATDAATAADSGTGLLAIPTAASDAVTAADSGTGLLAIPAAATDAVTPGDSGTGLLAIPAAASDAVTLGATGTQLAVLPAAASDAATAADSGTGLLTIPAAASDAVTASDSGTGVLAIPVVGSDAATPADSGTGLLAIPVAASDAATPSDSATQLAVLPAAASDAVSPADSGVQLAVLPAAASDAISPTDSGTGLLAIPASASDAATAADSATQLAVLPASSTDAVTPADSGTGTLAIPTAASDAVSPADSATQALSTSSVATDAASPGDSATQLAVLPAAATDAVTPADSGLGLLVAPEDATDPVTPTDSAASLSVASSAGQDAATAGDSGSTQATLPASASDAATASDSALGSLSLPASASDPVTLGGTGDSAAATASFATDAATPDDTATTTLARSSVATDAAAPTDAAGTAAVFGSASSDAAAPADSAGSALIAQTGATDAIAPADSAGTTAAQGVAASDGATVGGVATVRGTFNIATAESWTLGDSARLVGEASSIAADLIGLLRAKLPTPASMRGWLDTVTPQVFLNAADEGTDVPYLVVAVRQEQTRGLLGELDDHITFTLTCVGASALQAEAMADATEAIIFGTADDLRQISRTSRIDTTTLLNIAEIVADLWLDEPSHDAHVFPDVGTSHVVGTPASELLAILAADPGVQALGATVYLNAADEDATQPYVVVSSDHGPALTIQGQFGADRVSFSLACWAPTALEAETLADAVEVAIYATQLVLTGRTCGLDEETMDDVAVISAEAWLDEGESVASTSTTHEPNSAAADLVALLASADSMLALRVSVYLNAADEDAATPYLVVTASHAPTNTLSDLVVDHVTFTIAAWAETAAEAEAIADAIEGLLGADASEHDVTAREAGFDQQTTMDVAVLTVDRWV